MFLPLSVLQLEAAGVITVTLDAYRSKVSSGLVVLNFSVQIQLFL